MVNHRSIPALQPRDATGCQFLCYGDCCSGVPGAPHEATTAQVNAVAARLDPPPEFVCFLGDEVIGLTSDLAALRAQWRHWLDHEMAWLDRSRVPVYHTTGNHTTYDAGSEEVFREVLAHLPLADSSGVEGLSYVVRRDDVVLVIVDTMAARLGGEGFADVDWVDRALAAHADARHKLVLGHHPAFAVNGFSGPCQRHLDPANARRLWDVLVRQGATAYVCSHMLAFDVQVHEGVLQVMTAGAGTAHLMPAEVEYLHCTQWALDSRGVRYQVLDTDGAVREWLQWPLVLPPSAGWRQVESGERALAAAAPRTRLGPEALLIAWQVQGHCADDARADEQTLLCGWQSGPGLAAFWLGLRGPENRLSLAMSPAPGRSPHLWQGPIIERGGPFRIQMALHTGMGPGGVLWRRDDASPWSSCLAASPWGAERFVWPARWAVGHGRGGPADRPFRGTALGVSELTAQLDLSP